jgi:hypothetical protein
MREDASMFLVSYGTRHWNSKRTGRSPLAEGQGLRRENSSVTGEKNMVLKKRLKQG